MKELKTAVTICACVLVCLTAVAYVLSIDSINTKSFDQEKLEWVGESVTDYMWENAHVASSWGRDHAVFSGLRQARCLFMFTVDKRGTIMTYRQNGECS